MFFHTHPFFSPTLLFFSPLPPPLPGPVGSVGDVPRDQGFTRPKVLLLLPMRNSAYQVVKRLVALAQRETRADSVQVNLNGGGGAVCVCGALSRRGAACRECGRGKRRGRLSWCHIVCGSAEPCAQSCSLNQSGMNQSGIRSGAPPCDATTPSVSTRP